MNPADLLRLTGALLTGTVPAAGWCWQRACAALLRMALEQILREYWRHRQLSLDRASTRSQLLTLTVLAGPDVGATAYEAWNELSRALHHYTYELAPTAAELRSWYELVGRLQAVLRPPG